jgi:hypothetical protein
MDGGDMSESKDIPKEGEIKYHLGEYASPVPQAPCGPFPCGCCIDVGPAVQQRCKNAYVRIALEPELAETWNAMHLEDCTISTTFQHGCEQGHIRCSA